MYFNPTRSLLSTLACAIVAHSAHAVPPTVHVGQDNIKVTASCTLIFDTLSINDADGNGIVHIEAPQTPPASRSISVARCSSAASAHPRR